MANAKTKQTRAFEFINPPGLYDPSANGYSHVAQLGMGARIAFIAGQGGETPDGSLSPDFRLQVRQALANLAVAAAAVDANLQSVVKQTMLVVDHDEKKLHILGEEFARAYGPGMMPTATLIPVPRLALDGMLVEVEAIVAISVE